MCNGPAQVFNRDFTIYALEHFQNGVHSGIGGAVVAMTYSVAKDYLAHNIRCNCISPARVHTPFVDGYLRRNYPGKEQEMFEKLESSQPIGRMGRPEEIAALALYLCSDEAAFVTATVQNRTSQTIQLLEVDYPSASFGTQKLCVTLRSIFAILGSGRNRQPWRFVVLESAQA